MEMVKVTRMNGREIVVNAELIEFVEATPDTVLTLSTGRKLVLQDTVDEVIEKVLEYRRSIGTRFIVCGPEQKKEWLPEILSEDADTAKE
ncbi:flagellar FlbD family protein [Thermincola ferriacetica]|nr:flagellar FlbD family protein [Thermincola ferriacetica]